MNIAYQKNNEISFLVALVIIVYLIVYQPFAAWSFTIDDMYIPLRYAKNWVEGAGLVWNKGELPVEGYSNFSFVMIGALALKIGINPVVIFKSLGWLSLGIVTAGLYYLSRLWFSKDIALLPSLGLMLYKGEIFWGVSGLETVCYQALIVWALYYLLRGYGYNVYPQSRKTSNQNYLMLSAIIMILASLTRPEAPLIMVLFLLVSWFEEKKKYNWFLSIAVFSLGYIPYFIWRLHYFGYLFPNPVYCKGLSNSFLTLDKNYLNLAGVFFILAIPTLKTRDKRCYYLVLPSLLYLILLVKADPIVAFYNRLFLPAFPFVLVLALIGFREIINLLIKTNVNLMLYIFFISVMFLFIPSNSLNGYYGYTINAVKGETLRKQVVNWLTLNITKPNQIVLGDSGLIPYLSSLNFIDSYCLNNKNMAHINNNVIDMFSTFCVDIFKRHPQVIILTALIENHQIIYAPADQCLKKILTKNNLYKFNTFFKTDDQQSSYRYEIYSALN